MLGKSGELRIRTGSSKDLSVACGHHAPALALESSSNDYGAAASGTGIDELVNKVNKVVREANGYLLAHPKMVADWYHYSQIVACATLKRVLENA